METVQIVQAVSIRDKGFDEIWLQDQIYENPACLGLGDLEALMRERRQSSGGRLDILLKDPVDDTMYEVEVWITPVLIFTNAFVERMVPIKGVTIVNKRYLLNILKKPNGKNAVIWEKREGILEAIQSQ